MVEIGQRKHYAFKQLALAPKFLRAFVVFPDGGVFGEGDDFG
jgi:hypothetical protein